MQYDSFSPFIMDFPFYEAIVHESIAALPERIRKELHNVIVVIENLPPERPDVQGVLLGLYEGVPLTAWGRSFSSGIPDKITLYRASIERVARSPEEIPHLIRETLWHEIGHAFGLDHTQIRKMEERWRKNRLPRTERDGSGSP